MEIIKSAIQIYNIGNHDLTSIMAASKSLKEITKQMVRVQSSNVWAITIDIKDRRKNVGDVFAQFKNKNGGAGDIYVYYDVPVNVYRRWITAPSKGHYFWQFLRQNYPYSKLTGDRKTKLPHGIN